MNDKFLSRWRNNLVDEKLEDLVKAGVIEDTKGHTYCKEVGFKISNLYSQRYWSKFVSYCDDELVEFVLSKPQTGNWNGWLYAACEIRKGIEPNR